MAKRKSLWISNLPSEGPSGLFNSGLSVNNGSNVPCPRVPFSGLSEYNMPSLRKVGCLVSDSSINIQQAPAECPAIVHETVCVQAEVTITPVVVPGTIESFCVGEPIIGDCPGILVDECTFTVSQSICVQIPLTFSASATAVPTGIVCGTPDVGPCPE